MEVDVGEYFVRRKGICVFNKRMNRSTNYQTLVSPCFFSSYFETYFRDWWGKKEMHGLFSLQNLRAKMYHRSEGDISDRKSI